MPDAPAREAALRFDSNHDAHVQDMLEEKVRVLGEHEPGATR